MTVRTLTAADEAEIVTRYRKGASMRALAERFEVGYGTVVRVLNKHAVDRRPNVAMHPADTSMIVSLRGKGYPWAAIAEVVRMSPSGVRRRYEEATRRVDPTG